MSIREAADPICHEAREAAGIATIIEPRARDIGGLTVRRILPSAAHRRVGPFVFFDHMGPADLAIGKGIDVRPHPHINLATVTYLFEGEIVHRDSLGFEQAIRPGAVNWMTAGRGITHSERSGDRTSARRLHGIQLWVALPTEDEETDPSFTHHPAETLPEIVDERVTVRVLLGSAFDAESPVKTFSPMFYADARLLPGGTLALPSGYEERAVHVVDGAVRCADVVVEAPRMIVFAKGANPTIEAERESRLMLLGGDPLEGERHIWWNFVSSSKARIEQAKRDYKEGRFAPVPGEDEFIPLPE